MAQLFQLLDIIQRAEMSAKLWYVHRLECCTAIRNCTDLATTAVEALFMILFKGNKIV